MKRSFGWLTFAILLFSIAAGFFVDRFVRARQPAEVRAAWLMKSGKATEAEALYWGVLQRPQVTVPLVIAFLDAHLAGGVKLPKLTRDGQLETFEKPAFVGVLESDIDAFFARGDLSYDVVLLGTFWRTRTLFPMDIPFVEVERVADAEPPMPWANHLLGRSAWRGSHEDLAARRYEREGVSFDRTEDIDSALQIYEEAGAWEKIGERLADPRVDRLASAWIHFRYAIQVHDWRRAFVWSWKATYGLRFSPGPLALAAISALAWFVFCARLGRMTERPLARVPLYLASFALGMLSVYFTDALIALQEAVLHLERAEGDDALRNVLYFLFGVGFREELSKLLCFVPLVPLLLREKSTRLDVVVCGALVGLGFAAIENLLYFERDDLASAMARFLTAKFLHMSMTALTATALVDACREPDKRAFDFSKTLLIVMALHGTYDFFLTSHGGLAYLAMGVFIYLARSFMSTVHGARPRVGRGVSVLHVFVVGMAVVVGASFVYGSALVGPAAVSSFLFEGLIGLFIVIYFFVQEFREL